MLSHLHAPRAFRTLMACIACCCIVGCGSSGQIMHSVPMEIEVSEETPPPLGETPPPVADATCTRNTEADVVALDQPFYFNRMGASQPDGLVFALAADVVPRDALPTADGFDGGPYPMSSLQAGNVRLRSGKRPRPLVLRMNVGDCLSVRFKNLMAKTTPAYLDGTGFGTDNRQAGLFVQGIDYVGSINSDGSWVGANPGETGSLAMPDSVRTYQYYAPQEGTFLIYSTSNFDLDGNIETITTGLFGALHVQPEGAEWYRSQVTHADLMQSTYRVAYRNGRPYVPENPLMNLRPALDENGNQIIKFGRDSVWTLTTEVLEIVEGEPRFFGTVKQAPVLFATEDGRRYLATAATGHPLINYDAVYPPDYPVAGIRCRPILKMLGIPLTPRPSRGEVECQGDPNATPVFFFSDLTAIITGPSAGRFPYSNTSPSFSENPAYPDRRQPYREFTVIYHLGNALQAFQSFYEPNLKTALQAGSDNFAINYGTGGIGAEILGNRLGVGPMGDPSAVDLKYEEFFLSSWAVGDPAMVVDVPANAQNQFLNALEQPVFANPDSASAFLSNRVNNKLAPPRKVTEGWTPLTFQKATKAFYPDDPSNVYHSYMRDHLKYRIANIGANPPHIHHMHAHQWLHTANSDDAHYLDSQMLLAGAAYTAEMVYNGSGNRNQTVGDAIFHCHFYPHFAQGMWSLWRVHDVFEAGTRLDASGRPLVGARALPDGEIERGTPIPAVVPLPTLAMAPLPGKVRLTTAADSTVYGDYALPGRRAIVEPSLSITGVLLRDEQGQPLFKNPGYPFFIPGVAGHRAPHPPMDFAWVEEQPGLPQYDSQGNKTYLDGGLPRHLVLDGKIFLEYHTRWDFTKDFVLYDTTEKKLVDGNLVAFQLPENGTMAEHLAMAAHAQRAHGSFLPDGEPGNFILNGLPPQPGAPYAAPDVDDFGNSTTNTRRYKAANVQMDVVFNKKGWHFPQQRFITLWEDVKPTFEMQRPPQPFFFRSSTGETVEFWHTNLVPNYYELDDFQVRTPTDILGQHIHLVKFDVTASDGAANGFNYEDGTLSPQEVQERIFAINKVGGLYGFSNAKQFVDWNSQTRLTLQRCGIDVYKVDPRLRGPQNCLFGNPPEEGAWDGAQTTIQKYDQDPLLNNDGHDRTLRTVFTHDHFGPSTHQQAGLYAGMLVEPAQTTWLTAAPMVGAGGSVIPEGTPMGFRPDGGPTSWEAVIVMPDTSESFREFALEFQDFQLVYADSSRLVEGPVPATSALFSLTDATTVSALVQSLEAGIITPLLVNSFALRGLTINATDYAVSVPSPDSAWQINRTNLPADAHPEYFGVTLTPDTTLRVRTPTMHDGWSDPAWAINAPPDGNNSSNGAPFPNLVSYQTALGTYSLSYRNEPLPYRVNTILGANGNNLSGTDSINALDLSQAFRSIERFDNALNRQPAYPDVVYAKDGHVRYFPPALGPLGSTGARPEDPYTPLLRAYENDKVQIRTLVGAHVTTLAFELHGLKWFAEPGDDNSGYRSTQGMGLSEHYEMLFRLPPTQGTDPADYLYMANAGTDGLTSGMWGILRAFDGIIPDLEPVPGNPQGSAPPDTEVACPPGAPPRAFDVTATMAKNVLTDGQIVYNARGQVTAATENTTTDGQFISITPDTINTSQTLVDPDALLYVYTDSLDSTTGLLNGPVEPLILRARAGECITVTLRNDLDPTDALFTTPQAALAPFNTSINDSTGKDIKADLLVSSNVGLHAQLVSYDVTQNDGTNVGFNPIQTVAPTQTGTQTWYAGNLTIDGRGRVQGTPVEFGTINLLPSDPLLQHRYGLVGALIVEPERSKWQTDVHTFAAATITPDTTDAEQSHFREFVALLQNDLALEAGTNVSAFNYRSEPYCMRYPTSCPANGIPNPPGGNFSQKWSNTLVQSDPVTPVFAAGAGTPVRLRLLSPGDKSQNSRVFYIHGHGWQEAPYQDASTVIGDNPDSNYLGGVQIIADEAYTLALDHAGGAFGVTGDYLYALFFPRGGPYGAWGVIRVSEPGKDAVVITQVEADLSASAPLTVNGANTVVPETGAFADRVTISLIAPGGQSTSLGGTTVDPTNGSWNWTSSSSITFQSGSTIRVESSGGGVDAVQVPPFSNTIPTYVGGN